MSELAPRPTQSPDDRSFANTYPDGADPRLVDLIEKISAATKCQFVAATFGEQQASSMPGGAMLPDGASLLPTTHAKGKPSAPSLIESMMGGLNDQIALTAIPNGRPILCMKVRVDDDTALVLQVGLTNIVRTDLPSFELSIASRDGFTLKGVEAILGPVDPKWALMMAGGPDLSFLQRVNSRLKLTPQSIEDCIGILSRVMTSSLPPLLDQGFKK